MPQTTLAQQITRVQAEATLAAIRVQFAEHIDESAGPTLYAPGHHCAGWAIAWQGLYGWTDTALFGELDEDRFYQLRDSGLSVRQAGDQATTYQHQAPEGVYTEPVNGWCLGLYPA